MLHKQNKETNLKHTETTKHIQRDVWENITWFNTGIKRFGAWDKFAIGGPNFLELYEQVSDFFGPLYSHIFYCAEPYAFPG